MIELNIPLFTTIYNTCVMKMKQDTLEYHSNQQPPCITYYYENHMCLSD